MTQYCQNCGSRLNGGEAYCPRCQKPTGLAKGDLHQKDGSKTLVIALAIGCVIMYLASLCLTGLYLRNRSHRGANNLLPLVALFLPWVVFVLTDAATKGEKRNGRAVVVSVLTDAATKGEKRNGRAVVVSFIATNIIWDVILLLLAVSNPV